jgi:hypothetical protein
VNLLPPPGPARTRQLLSLGVLAVVGAGAWMYMNSAMPTAAPPATSNSPAAGVTGPRAAANGPVGLPAPLKLAALSTGEGTDSTGTNRDPFRFGQPPPPPPPPYVPPPPPPPPPPPAPPTVPEIPLQLILLETLPGNVRTATLKDTATSAVIGPSIEGSVLDGRYRLLKVGLESVVVAYLDGTGQRTLPLGR